MRRRTLPRQLLPFALILFGITPGTSLGVASVVTPDRFAYLKMTCHTPVPLARDCSVRKGPTRPIAIERFRMNIAASSDGRTVMINQVRFGPDHNGGEFAQRPNDRGTAIAAIRELRRWLHREGVCLERWETLRHGGQVRGYLLAFSDDVYPMLHRKTVLESEHWLPRQLSRR